MSHIFFFADLDDTLFSSIRKQKKSRLIEQNELLPTAFLKNGEAFSAMNRRQHLFWNMLKNSGEIIPTTARNIDSFSRVQLEFNSRYAIVSNGAIILEDGKPEKHWLERGQEISNRLAGTMHTIRNFLEQEGEKIPDVFSHHRVIADYNMPLFVLTKCTPETYQESALYYLHMQLLEYIDANTFFIHRNGNNLAIYPKQFSKKYAVEYMQKEILHLDNTDLSIGLGDSNSDFPFMKQCDFLLTPSNSQIISTFTNNTSA